MTNEQEREAWLAEHERLVTLYARACFLSRSHKEMDGARDSLLAHASTVGEFKANLTAYAAELRREVERLCSELRTIGDYAHDHSTGPAVPDALWEIRSMAYTAEASHANPSSTTATREAQPMPDGGQASAPEPCPRGADRPEPSCTNRHQCWEPCGELGHSAEHARIAGVLPLEVPSQHTDPSKWPSKADIDRADPRCKGCDLPNGHQEYCRCTPRVQEVPRG